MSKSQRMDLLFDMETRDPDDVLTLCLVATHPKVSLRAVTINPGSTAQVGVVRHVLARLGCEHVPIGSRNPKAESDAVSSFHHEWLGAVTPVAEPPTMLAPALLAKSLATHPNAVLLTGAPLHLLRLLFNQHPDARIDRWVAQGGFAGDNVVGPENRLSKFEGLTTCPTFNFNGDPKATLMALATDRIGTRDLVSKNVTHGVAYDRAFHDRVAPLRHGTRGLELIYEAMETYLRDRPEGKLLHDPLAACAAIDRSIFTWAEDIEVVREHGEWGSKLASAGVRTRTAISIAVDRDRFFEVLTASD